MHPKGWLDLLNGTEFTASSTWPWTTIAASSWRWSGGRGAARPPSWTA